MDKIIQILEEKGPLTGKELFNLTGMEVFDLWRACKSPGIVIRRVGKRYLRFDRNVEGYARLSPAIQREFLTYSVIGLEKDMSKIVEKARRLRKKIEVISEKKLSLAKSVVKDIINSKLKEDKDYIECNACFIIGGDVPLGMAHAEPRPEVSTGKMVAGSDLDIIVITIDEFLDDIFKMLDEAIYEAKFNLLNQPPNKEEIDYLIKRISKVRKQARMRSFEDMVACKIINEGKFLHGSKRLYMQVLEIMEKNNVPEKLRRMQEEAARYREKAEKHLLEKNTDLSYDEHMKFFTTSDEFNEIF